MDLYLNPGPHEVAHIDIDTDCDEIDQILRQMELENSLASLSATDLFDLISYAGPTDMSQTGMSFESPTSSSQSFFTSPLVPSLTTSSIAESPLMLDYDFPSDDTTINDGVGVISPGIMDFPVHIPLDWPMPSHSWLHKQVDHNDSGVTWDEYLHDGQNTQDTTQFTNASNSSPRTTPIKHPFTCSHCSASFVDRTKLKVHTNKHTKPFRCGAAGCGYATAEKKSLHRHLLAKSKWDEDHRLAMEMYGVKDTKHRCPKQGCTYSTIREDNLRRHILTCTA